MRSLVFIDCETTGLDPSRHQPWEIALIWRDESLADDFEMEWHVPVDLSTAEAGALRLNGFYDRFGVDLETSDPRMAAQHIAGATADAHLVGANPAFDAAMLDRFLRTHGYGPAWHYRLIDVEVFAAGALGWPAPKGLRDTAEALGLTFDVENLHTAMGDTRLTRDVYDAVVGFTQHRAAEVAA